MQFVLPKWKIELEMHHITDYGRIPLCHLAHLVDNGLPKTKHAIFGLKE
jgi:hypothetical protein